MNCFNRLYLSATDFAVSVTEQLGHINDANRISKTTLRIDCCFSIAPTTVHIFKLLESTRVLIHRIAYQIDRMAATVL
ncbi:hypothetical protein DPMN_174832 [Dreissena polymorpha]|uniref:Uncharacterized protein n=1 Tax=Dreissena polymorpha TaxID=45954 RepID=A0A9D4E6Q6_DREPO|nr:hypothetical protein DPMN_174832 [Dreissena polymorpha]